jgi:hypothetical protein
MREKVMSMTLAYVVTFKVSVYKKTIVISPDPLDCMRSASLAMKTPENRRGL